MVRCSCLYREIYKPSFSTCLVYKQTKNEDHNSANFRIVRCWYVNQQYFSIVVRNYFNVMYIGVTYSMSKKYWPIISFYISIVTYYKNRSRLLGRTVYVYCLTFRQRRVNWFYQDYFCITIVLLYHLWFTYLYIFLL